MVDAAEVYVCVEYEGEASLRLDQLYVESVTMRKRTEEERALRKSDRNEYVVNSAERIFLDEIASVTVLDVGGTGVPHYYYKYGHNANLTKCLMVLQDGEILVRYIDMAEFPNNVNLVRV